MKYKEYLIDRIPCIITNVLSMLGCTIFLLAIKTQKGIPAILSARGFYLTVLYERNSGTPINQKHLQIFSWLME